MGQITDLVTSNILSISHLYVCLNGSQLLVNTVQKEISTVLGKISKDIDICATFENVYEYPGIKKMYSLSQIKDNQNKLFIYFHTKGITSCRSPSDRNAYNVFLTRSLLWNYQHIINVFNLHPTINKIGLFPARNGWIWFNFFWVRGQYLSHCKEPQITTRRHLYEDWLGSHGHSSYDDCFSICEQSDFVYFSAQQACSLMKPIITHMKSVVITNPITLVTYGCDQQVTDVTRKFIKLVGQNNYISISNQTLGCDPSYGHQKILTITLRNGTNYQFNEGDYLIARLTNQSPFTHTFSR
jgi:hypothetical protein